MNNPLAKSKNLANKNIGEKITAVMYEIMQFSDSKNSIYWSFTLSLNFTLV